MLRRLLNPFSPPGIVLLVVTLLCYPPAGLAQDYETGKQAYLDKDYERAYEILKPLADQGNSDAQVTLGLMYDYGHGVERDPARAIEWYTRAAEQGIPLIQHDLGVKYFQGQEGIPQDYLEAAKWWEQAANAGLSDSQFNLGLMYYRGLGLEQDYAKASELFLRAAEQDHANAQYSLAVMYAFAQGKERDYAEALKWFRKSAEQDVAQAQYNLGVFYENGYGVAKDPDEAKIWYRKAADQDLDKARERLAALEAAQTATTAAAVTAEGPETVQPDSPTAVAETPAPATGDLRRDDWLRQQDPGNYTLQLISLTSEETVAKYLRDHGLQEQAGYIKVVIDGTTRYNAIYGLYDSHQNALIAIAALPEAVKRDQPWVRNIGVLHKVMP
jgi:TPR repeat protein